MKVVIQRVKNASVAIDDDVKSEIGGGFLALVGIAKNDTSNEIDNIAGKISKLRIFEDIHGKMNLDIIETGGEVLSVPQFTLLGRTDDGNRPGFDLAAVPDEAKRLWKEFNAKLREAGIPVAEGEFGAHMEVSLINDGPVTFVLEV